MRVVFHLVHFPVFRATAVVVAVVPGSFVGLGEERIEHGGGGRWSEEGEGGRVCGREREEGGEGSESRGLGGSEKGEEGGIQHRMRRIVGEHE